MKSDERINKLWETSVHVNRNLRKKRGMCTRMLNIENMVGYRECCLVGKLEYNENILNLKIKYSSLKEDYSYVAL